LIPADLAASNRAAYDFSEPKDVRVLAGGDPLLVELVATRAFQRLKSIRFLGGIDYLLVRAPNGAKGNIRYTRFQHSLGVARLALQYCDARESSRVECCSSFSDLGNWRFISLADKDRNPSSGCSAATFSQWEKVIALYFERRGANLLPLGEGPSRARG